MAFRCTPPTKDPVATLAYRPWELAIKPFQVAPQTWYVAGQTWVGCYLIDTGGKHLQSGRKIIYHPVCFKPAASKTGERAWHAAL